MYRVRYKNVTVNEIGEIILKTKFIGLEGFNEIESLSTTKKRANHRKLTNTQKTIRFAKRLAVMCTAKLGTAAKSVTATQSVNKSRKPQTTVLDRHYSENRKSNQEFSCSAKEAVTGFSLKRSKVYAYSTPNQRTHTIIKKKAVLAVVACMSAVTLSCVTVASALDYSGNSTAIIEKPEATTAVAVDETKPANSIFPCSASSDEALAPIKEDAYDAISNSIIADNGAFTVAGLYIDDELIGITDDTQGLEAALEQVLADYRKDYDEQTTTEFANNVEIKATVFSADEIKSAETLIAIAEDKFSIALSTDIVYTRDVDYEVKTEYDDSQFSSYEEVKTEGKKGEELVTVRTTFVDGIQTDAVETEAKVIKKPKDKVIIKGSKDGEFEPGDSSSTGAFIWPLPYTHNITSNFEWRWGRMHNGLDIAAGGVYGQSIIAADGGTVTFAGNDGGGYGNYVIIDHGNGYVTLYAHCSSLAVSSGQYVSQGDVIAYVGSTGNSTGPHLHFEIQVNGSPTNPLEFVS